MKKVLLLTLLVVLSLPVMSQGRKYTKAMLSTIEKMNKASDLPEFIGGGPAAAKPLFLEAEKKFGEFQNELAKLKDVQLPAEE